uniref:UBX domain-containing protein n=2 Tax=Timema TaxID=61471 RepID=A0A7R9IEC4_9NEOP|nr:unnamed protein product [Timema tahoe]
MTRCTSVPDNVEDETAGCIHFADEFTNRYGGCHPEFFPGSLDEAVKEACLRPAKDRRLLAVYLHHDGSVLSNVFCTQLLGFESVLQCLNAHFVVWGWDLTHESNKHKFLASVSQTLGAVAAMTIRTIDKERLPALIIIMRLRSSTEIFTVVHGTLSADHSRPDLSSTPLETLVISLRTEPRVDVSLAGNVGVSELLTSLIQAVDVFTDQQRTEIREEEERNAREMVKMEQDAAYQESLEADRAKEQAKRNQVMLENQVKQETEKRIIAEQIQKEAVRLEAESNLPEEPPESCGDGITKIRFRLPKEETVVRRFHFTTPLKVGSHCLVTTLLSSTPLKVGSHCLVTPLLSRLVHTVWSQHHSQGWFTLSGHSTTLKVGSHCLVTPPLSRLVHTVWSQHHSQGWFTLSGHSTTLKVGSHCLVTAPLSRWVHTVWSQHHSQGWFTLSGHTTPLKVLLNFLIVKGFPPKEYKVFSGWPRKDLTTLDPNATLQDLRLCPQETVILEER